MKTKITFRGKEEGIVKMYENVRKCSTYKSTIFLYIKGKDKALEFYGDSVVCVRCYDDDEIY